MQKAFAIGLLALITSTVRAQPLFQVSGRIVDTAGASIAQATVALLASSDTLNTASDEDGNFNFRKVRGSSFLIKVTMNGYLPYTRGFAIGEAQTSVRLHDVILRVNYQDLDPVIVSRPRPFIISGDTVSSASSNA